MPAIPDATRRVPIALGILLALVIGAFFLIPPAYRKNKVYRAHKVIAALPGELERQDWRAAGNRVRLALSLAPMDPDVQRAVATFCTKLESPFALQYWQMLVDSGHATRADRIQYVRSLLRIDRPEQARAILVDLLTEDRRDFECLELSVEALLREQRSRDALVAARMMTDYFPENDRGLFHLGQILLTQPEPSLRAQGEVVLWGLTLRDNPFLVLSIGLLSQRTNLAKRELRLLSRRIPETNSMVSQLLRLEIQEKLRPEAPKEEILAAALAALPSDAPLGPRLALSEWLYARNIAEPALNLIPEEAARTNSSALQSRLHGLALLGRWPVVNKLVEDRSLPLSPVLRDLFRAIVASNLGTKEEVVTHLASAAAGTRDDPSLARLVASQAEAFDQPGIAATALQNLMADPSRVTRTGPDLMRLLTRVDDTKPLLQALDRLLQFSPNDPQFRNARAWWLLVTGQRPAECRKVAQDLLKLSPGNPRYLCTLALSYLHDKDAEQALQIIEPAFLGTTNPPARVQLVYSAALGHAGQREAARRIARSLPENLLRTAEKRLIADWLDQPKKE